jgi:chromosome segregation ATPase
VAGRSHASGPTIDTAMPKSKLKTLSEADAARRGAVTGLTNLGREDEADRISRLSTKEYAGERGFEIVGGNPFNRSEIMAKRMTRAELEDRVTELEEQLEDVEEERDDLQEKVDSIAELVGEEDEDEDGSDLEDEEEED